jgi:hypothetical protein
MHEIMRMVDVLPAPLGPRNPNDSLGDGEVDTVDGDKVAEALHQAMRLDHGRDCPISPRIAGRHLVSFPLRIGDVSQRRGM